VVSRTDLLLTLPENQADVVNRSVGNQILPFPIDEPTLAAYLYWRANADEDPANRWLRSLLDESMQFQRMA
jgi:DNA-binding transcriptional LysR family regulator